MEVFIIKCTDINLMRRACESTMHQKRSSVTLDSIYRCEHSPIRTQMFWIEMINIPTFVSVHFARHSVGVTHFVTSNRDDRGGAKGVDRETLINHSMFINAEALINMARKRLCHGAHKEAIELMRLIKTELKVHDEDLAKYLVPECVRRNGCHEIRCCGYFDKYIHNNSVI